MSGRLVHAPETSFDFHSCTARDKVAETETAPVFHVSDGLTDRIIVCGPVLKLPC
jgi:hypothetical protein